MAEEEHPPCCCYDYPCCCADMETPQPYAKRSRRTREGDLSNWIDNTGSTAFAFDTTGTRSMIAVIDRISNTSSNRLGDTITLKSIQLRGVVTAASSGAVPVIVYCSLWLIYDRHPSGGSIPSISTLFTNVSGSNILLPNETNSQRFLTLRRWDFTLTTGPTTGAYDTRVWTVDEYVKTSLPCRYLASNSGGQYTDMEKGALFLVSFGNQGAGAGTAVTGTIVARTRWWNGS